MDKDSGAQRKAIQLPTKMSKADIEIMALHYYDGHSYAKIGEYLGIHKQSVKDRIDKCLKHLAQQGLPTPKCMAPPKRPNAVPGEHRQFTFPNEIIELMLSYGSKYYEQF